MYMGHGRLWGLAHKVTGVKSQDWTSAGWRHRKWLGDASQSGDWRTRSSVVQGQVRWISWLKQRANSLFLYLFVGYRPLMGWIRSTCFGENHLSPSAHQVKC